MLQAEETVAGFAPGARHKFLTFDPDFTLPEMQVHKPPPRVRLSLFTMHNKYSNTCHMYFNLALIK